MARATRSKDWGFPRWRDYGSASEAVEVRLCDRHGCAEPGDKPAPKSPNSPERWWFCEAHAAEYNRGWDYFEGLSAEDRAAREHDEARDEGGYRASAYQSWAGPGDGSRSRDEMRALDLFGLDAHASMGEVKSAWRKLAKENHPDVTKGDAEAAARFRAAQAAWDVIRAAEERREWKGA